MFIYMSNKLKIKLIFFQFSYMFLNLKDIFIVIRRSIIFKVQTNIFQYGVYMDYKILN